MLFVEVVEHQKPLQPVPVEKAQEIAPLLGCEGYVIARELNDELTIMLGCCVEMMARTESNDPRRLSMSSTR